MHMDIKSNLQNFHFGINVINKYHKLQCQLCNAVYNDKNL